MSFFDDGNASDEEYKTVRDHPLSTTTKEYIERLWDEYRGLDDANFLSDAKANFHRRFWEMYLAKSLGNMNYTVKTPGNTGPDFIIQSDSRDIYIEATAPGSGEGEDQVPELLPGGQDVPEEQIILRLRSSIREKNEKWIKWREKRIVSTRDCYIIAVNGGRVRGGLPPISCPPFIVKAVYPIGPLVAEFDTEKNKFTRTYNSHRSGIKKKSGSAVNTDYFNSEESKFISAVAYSRVDCVNHPTIEGNDLILVHNERAKNPLPRNLINLGEEYIPLNGRLKRVVHSQTTIENNKK